MARLQAMATAYKFGGLHPPKCELFDVLDARGHLRPLTAAGIDGNVREIYRALPFTVILYIWEKLVQRVENQCSADPAT